MPVINTTVVENIDITANGTYDVARYTEAHVNVAPPVPGENHIVVIDYDGTVLKEADLNTGDTFTLPTPPTHPRLTFDGWNSSEAIVNNEITIGNSDVIVGALYKTVSGLTEFDIIVNDKIGFTVKCGMTGNKDWGDGTTDTETYHTYSTAGSYIITCDGTEIPIACCKEYNDYDSGAIYMYQHVRIGELVTRIDGNAFYYNRNIKTYTFPDENIDISGYNTFQGSGKLQAIVFPNNITCSYSGYTIGTNNRIEYIVFPNNLTALGECFIAGDQLKSIVIPSSITSIGHNTFNNIITKKFVIPYSVTNFDSMRYITANKVIIYGNNISLGSQFFYSSSINELYILNGGTIGYGTYDDSSHGLRKLVLAGNLTSIGDNSFYNIIDVTELDLSGITCVPTLGNNTFNYYNPLLKVKVPSALYNDFINDAGWSKFADYMEAV